MPTRAQERVRRSSCGVSFHSHIFFLLLVLILIELAYNWLHLSVLEL